MTNQWRTVINDELRARVIALRTEGKLPYADIAQRLHVGSSTVRRILEPLGLDGIVAPRRRGNYAGYHKIDTDDAMGLTPTRDEPRLCRGFPLFCPDCPTPPPCETWDCRGCVLECRCAGTPEWRKAFSEWTAAKKRNKQAVEMYVKNKMDDKD
jgi:DNA-binding transcriptional ArsR family regulator